MILFIITIFQSKKQLSSNNLEETYNNINTEYTKNINPKAEDELIKPISYEKTPQYSLMYSYNMIS